MTDFQEEAEKILMGVHPQNPERSIQKATVLAYMARTEALKPEPVVVAPDEVWIITQKTGGGNFGILKVFTDEEAAHSEYVSLNLRASGTSGYWEVFLNRFSISS